MLQQCIGAQPNQHKAGHDSGGLVWYWYIPFAQIHPHTRHHKCHNSDNENSHQRLEERTVQSKTNAHYKSINTGSHTQHTQGTETAQIQLRFVLSHKNNKAPNNGKSPWKKANTTAISNPRR